MLSADEAVLFVAMTRDNSSWRVPLMRDGGAAKVGRFSLSFGTSGPDGLTMDQNGRLFVALASLGHVFVMAPNGETIARIKSCAGATCTNLVLEAANGTLLITESSTESVLMADFVTFLERSPAGATAWYRIPLRDGPPNQVAGRSPIDDWLASCRGIGLGDEWIAFVCGDPKLAALCGKHERTTRLSFVRLGRASPATGRRRPGSAPSSRAGFRSRSTSLEKTIVSLRTMKNDLMVDTRQKSRRGNPLAVGVSTASAPRFSIVLGRDARVGAFVLRSNKQQDCLP